MTNFLYWLFLYQWSFSAESNLYTFSIISKLWIIRINWLFDYSDSFFIWWLFRSTWIFKSQWSISIHRIISPTWLFNFHESFPSYWLFHFHESFIIKLIILATLILLLPNDYSNLDESFLEPEYLPPMDLLSQCDYFIKAESLALQ